MARPWYGEISDYRYRLVDYVGGGFLVGASFGSAFHFTKGLHNSPNGGRLAGGVRAVRTNVPRVAGRSGAFLAVFWGVESAMCLARDWRDDHWNTIAAGAATAALANARRGVPAATLFGLLGAASFAGLAGASCILDLCQGLEVQMKSSPADPIVGSVEYRSNNHGTPDLSAMERDSEMTPKDV